MSIRPVSAFNRRFYLLVTGLAAACLLFGLLVSLNAARVRSAIMQPNRQLVLQLNQSIGQVTARQITITPRVPFTANGNGRAIGIQFGQPLLNDTQYTVRIKAQDGRVTRYSFTTGSASFYYLAPNNGEGTIYRRDLAGGDKKDAAIIQGEPIDDYVIAGNALIYVLKDPSGQHRLKTLNLATSATKTISLPESGTARNLRASPDGRAFGYIFNSSNFRSDKNNVIYTYDVATAKMTPVIGFDGKMLKATDWQFARNGSSIAAVGIDSTLLLINSGQPPLPLGQVNEIEGFGFDDGTLFINSLRAGRQSVNLRTGERQSPPRLSSDLYLFAATPLHTQPGMLLRANSSQSLEASTQLLLQKQSGGPKKIFTSNDIDGYVTATALSPNDQYVAVESQSTADEQTTIRIVDVSTGQSLTKLEGGKVRWPLGD